MQHGKLAQASNFKPEKWARYKRDIEAVSRIGNNASCPRIDPKA
jgi:hypothetical protein